MKLSKNEKIAQAARKLALCSVEARRRKCRELGLSFGELMSELAKQGGKRSVEVRLEKWGGEGMRRRMRAWGKLGGRGKKGAKRHGN